MAKDDESDGLAQLRKDLAHLKEIVVEGNGHSLVTQIALIIQDIETIRKNLDDREDALRREIRIAIAVATGIIGLVISGWNLAK